MKPLEISTTTVNLGGEVGVQDALVWARTVPAGRDGSVVFGRTLLEDEPDPGTKIFLYPYLGESLVFRPGDIRIYLKDVDRRYKRDVEGYAPIADLLWLWMTLGTPIDPPTFRYLFAAGRRLDVAYQLRREVLQRLEGDHETLLSFRNAIFTTLGLVETLCVSLGRAIEMIVDAPSVTQLATPVPEPLQKIRPALRDIRNAFEHIEDRAQGRVRNKPNPDAVSIFDQRKLFDSGEVTYANHSINIYAEMAGIFTRARTMLFEIARAQSGEGIQTDKEVRFFGSASLEDYERVKERAYFLWLNRTGSKWWDAEGNWKEAEKLQGDEWRA